MIVSQYMPKTSTRTITAKVEQYNGSTLLNTFNYNDYLKSVEVDRVCEEGKLFGVVASQKVTVTILESKGTFTITDKHSLKVYFDNGQGYITPFPVFYITDVNRDKVAKEVKVTGYCLANSANNYTVADLELSSFTLLDFARTAATKLGATGISLVNLYETDSLLQLNYEQGANFDGTETLRQALTALAEALGAIIFFDYNNNLTIKRYSRDYTVDIFTPNDYFEWETKDSILISEVASITELGDNVAATTGNKNGVTAYLRDNPFLELREDVATILAEIARLIKPHRAITFDMSARGNYLIELGDYFSIMSKEGGTTSTYLLNDSIKYSGGLSQKLFINYTETAQVNTNPVTLGESLKQTYAKVDKANRQIELLVSDSNMVSSKLTALEMTTEGIAAKVESVEIASDNLTGALGELTKKVNATMSADDIKLEIKKELLNGSTKVETATGYVFNEDGLTVSKSGSEMETTITEDGMTVSKDGGAVLTANHEGVTAIDLKATTFLIVGTNSRFEDYSNHSRTACFWIGGNK